MKNALNGMFRRDSLLERHLRHDEQFHRAILEAANNPLLGQMMDLLWAPLLETFRITDRSTEHPERSNANHREVSRAMRAKHRQKAAKELLTLRQQNEKR